MIPKLILLAVVAALLLMAGCVKLTDGSGQELKIIWNDGEVSLAPEQMGEFIMKALVKGSIYETGESVSVFGTCLDSEDNPFPGTVGVLSAWYPNGTVLFSNISMTEFETGYYLYASSMNAVQGTYLTEFTCTYMGQTARAYGEWQNPLWVRKIGDINTTTTNIDAQVNNITISIGDLRVNMTDSFEITWDKLDNINASINNTFINISNQLTYIAMVANSSVDRNDSLVVNLLYQLLAGHGANNGTLTVTEYATHARFWRGWGIFVKVFNSDGEVDASQVSCNIESNNPGVEGPFVLDYFESFDQFESRSLETIETQDFKYDGQVTEQLSYISGGFWYHVARIKVPPFEEYMWNVTCAYN